MSNLFHNKYRIASARLQTWNYGNAGMYFITICTANREFYFGEIINAQMQLSELGKIAETEWIKTVELRPDMNLELGEFVVMPNHMHGIILIGKNEYNSGDDGDIRVETQCIASLRPTVQTTPVPQTNQKNPSINLARNQKTWVPFFGVINLR